MISVSCGYESANGVGGWDYARAHPEFHQTFNQAMSSLAGSVHRAIVGAYDFTGIDVLVDIGGGHGRLMAQILERHPRMRGIVHDMPHVVDGAAAYMAERGLADRCQAVGGDFFAGVPQGADAYIMTAILHDWDDDGCVTILRNCRRAMKPGGRVLIGDFVLKPVNEPDYGKLIDLEMLVVTRGGRERSEEDFRRVLGRADLELNQILPLPTGTSLIEARPARRSA